MEYAFEARGTRTRTERLIARLFPAKLCETPEPSWMGKGEVVFTDVGVMVSFLDRLRVLLRGRMRVQIRVVCEHPVGRTESASVAYPVWTHPEESR